MFVDYVKIQVVAGNGGNGCVAFRREKYVPKGGPAGGNGGNGGDIIFRASRNVTTLVNLRYNRLVKSGNGTHGQGSSLDGRNCDPTIVEVPMGTIIKNAQTNKLIVDLIEDEQEFIVAKGGKGGKGNKFFKSNSNQAPRISELGSQGESLELVIELKLLADVGIVGMPNAGKSTFISVSTNAKAIVNSYPFTTITPNLGVAKTSDNREFVMADMPGLIEGASLGRGLGHQFLRHIERTTVLCHLLDMSDDNVIENYELVNNELELFNKELMLRPQVIVANKMDMPNANKNLIAFKNKYLDLIIFETTAIINEGVEIVLHKLADLVEQTPRFTMNSEDYSDEYVSYRFDGDFEEFYVDKIDNIYIVSGETIEKIFMKTNFDQDESILKFAYTIKKMGIEDKLREIGCQNGDIVKILDFEFEMID